MSRTRIGSVVCDEPIYENGQHIGFCGRGTPLTTARTNTEWTSRNGKDYCPLHSRTERGTS